MQHIFCLYSTSKFVLLTTKLTKVWPLLILAFITNSLEIVQISGWLSSKKWNLVDVLKSIEKFNLLLDYKRNICIYCKAQKIHPDPYLHSLSNIHAYESYFYIAYRNNQARYTYCILFLTQFEICHLVKSSISRRDASFALSLLIKQGGKFRTG